ncbi:TPA: hypothetical protein ACKFMB_000189 [Citrobacter amalonaticus]
MRKKNINNQRIIEKILHLNAISFFLMVKLKPRTGHCFIKSLTSYSYLYTLTNFLISGFLPLSWLAQAVFASLANTGNLNGTPGYQTCLNRQRQLFAKAPCASSAFAFCSTTCVLTQSLFSTMHHRIASGLFACGTAMYVFCSLYRERTILPSS